MKRLRVLVATNDTASREQVRHALSTRNFRVVNSALDATLATAMVDAPSFSGEDSRALAPHDVAVIALSGSPADVAAEIEGYRAYRAISSARAVKAIVVGGGDAGKAAAASLGYKHLAAIDPHMLLVALDAAVRHLITILVADDEPLIRRMFAVYLGNEGYKVVTAEDGEDAGNKVREVIPDLVITDIKMPVMDGYELCRAIKECRDTQHIPVVIVSALGGELDVEKGFNAGANEYLTKPVDLSELASRIEDIFRGIQLRGRERVMVITQSPIERGILQIGLGRQGFEVVSCGDTTEAWSVAMEQTPSIVVSDLEVPNVEALVQLRERMRHVRKLADVPLVLLLNPKTSKVDRHRKEELKASSQVSKPFSIERLVALIERILGERRSKVEAERDMLLQSIMSLVQALEARDKYTRGHSDNVARYTVMIARRLLDTEEEVERYKLSAQLHDIGKIGVPDSILLKPAKLTDEEMAIMQTHPGKGAEILGSIESLRDIVPGVRWHHERMDGRGYPDGLMGMEIPLQARVIAVADTFDALTSNRPYRNGCTVERALKVIRDNSGTQFDPVIVDAFCRAAEEHRLILPVQHVA